MGGDGFWQRQIGGQQERGPVDAVEADDLFADEMEIGGPVFFELLLVGGVITAVADGGHVVGEGVEPDVDNVLFVTRDRDAPLEAGARDAEVLEAGFDEAEDLVAARLGFDTEFPGFDEIDDLLLVLREAEVVVLLGDGFGDAAAVRTGGAGRDINEGLLGDAVLASVGVKVDRAAFLQSAEELLDAALVFGAGGADEAVVGDAHALPEVLEGGGDLVGELLWGEVCSGGGAGYFLSVLVGAGEEKGVVAE